MRQRGNKNRNLILECDDLFIRFVQSIILFQFISEIKSAFLTICTFYFQSTSFYPRHYWIKFFKIINNEFDKSQTEELFWLEECFPHKRVKNGFYCQIDGSLYQYLDPKIFGPFQIFANICKYIWQNCLNTKLSKSCKSESFCPLIQPNLQSRVFILGYFFVSCPADSGDCVTVWQCDTCFGLVVMALYWYGV